MTVLSDHQVRVLLDRLCAQLGFCLPPDAIAQIRSDPPEEARAFADAVFAAEQMDPEMADRHLYRQVRDMISQAFHDADV